MNQAIANIIKGHIKDLDFVDKIAGLTSVLTFDMRAPDNTVVQKSFPVACCVTPDECEKQGAYNDLMPNSEYKSVIYFEDGGLSFEKYEGNWKYYKSTLRLVAWLNIEKLTESGICKSEIPCTYAAHVITEIIRALPEFPQNTHGPIERVYSEIKSQIVRNPSIFSAYTYDEKHVQYLMAPYDYFALTIETNFAICLSSRATPNATCVPEVIPVLVTILPPTELVLTVISDTQIDLTWTNNALNQAVVIESSLDGNTFVEIYETLAGDTSFSNTGLTVGTRYYYRIRSFSGGDYSAYTSVEDALIWTPALELDEETPNFWVQEGTRNDLTLPDTINPGVGDASILTPCYVSVDRTENFTLSATKNLGTVYSIYFRGRLDNSAYNSFLYNSTTAIGMWFSLTNRFWYHYAGSVIGKSANNTLAASLWTDNLFHDFVLTRNGTALNFYIDGVQSGVEVTLTSNPDFLVSAMFKTNYGVKYLTECKIFSTVKTAALAKMDVPDSNWFIFCGYSCVDIISGEYLAIATAVGFDNAYYSAEGSQRMLDYGYSRYTKNKNYGRLHGWIPDIYIPTKTDGTFIHPAIYAPATNIEFVADYVGNSIDHNLADCYINLPGANWDRSDVTIWGDKARVAIDYIYGKYDAANPNRWHISELNQATIILYANSNHKSQSFVKVSDNSFDNRQVLKELFDYPTNKTGDDITKIFAHTGDSGVHAVDYYFSTLHLCTTYLNKVLAFDGVDTLSLSTDGGTTFPTTLQIAGMEDMIQFSYIWENGNINFFTHNHAYFSDDSLATYSEITPKNADGSNYSLAATGDNFRPLSLNQRFKIGALEMLVWGRYTTAGDYSKVTAWYMLNNGANLKVAYENSVTDPILTMDHIHCINYQPLDGSFWMQCGDNANKEHWIKGFYNVGADTWSWQVMATYTVGNPRISTTGFIFDGDYVYITGDATAQFIKVRYIDILDVSKYEIIYSGYKIWGTVGGKYNKEMIITDEFVSTYYTMLTSIDKIHFIRNYLLGSVKAQHPCSFLTITPKNNAGYYRADIWADTEVLIADLNRGQVLMIRIIKPED